MVKMSAFYLTQLFCSFFMCGLIWLVQMVHYPSFSYVDEDKFTSFENFHTGRISMIVVPIMLIELISALALAILDQGMITVVNLVIVLLIWLATFSFSVPCHVALSKSKNSKSIEKLVITNWLRTVFWTAKSILLMFGVKFYV